MADVNTLSTALAAAVTFTVQANVLENLRASLFYADPQYAQHGSFDSGTDQLMWVSVPDLAVATTPLTEGARPFYGALTMATVTTSTVQYGNLLGITDIAKIVSPVELTSIASDHLSRQAQETLDQISRDAIAAGGTQFIGSLTVTTRAAITNIAGDKLHVKGVGGLDILKAKMFAAKIPPFADGFYRLFVTPGQGYDLMQDTNFIDAYKYVDNMPLISGEIGQISGFRVIKVVNAPTVSSGVTVHLAIALGAVKGWGAGELQSLQVFHVAPGGDHADPLAQQELIGWKIMWGTAVLSNSFYFRVETAATVV
jgi:N4-gp56 family major capsid protein